MEQFEDLEFSDGELSQMLAAWVIPVPSERMRARVFPERRRSEWPVLPWYRSFGAACAIQVCAVALLLLVLQPPVVQRAMKTAGSMVLLAPYRAKLQASGGGGGGGGQHQPTQVSRGAAPPFASKAFIPPAVAVAKPLLAVMPTIVADAPQLDATVYGDPLSRLVGNSAGQGVDGFGNGSGGGVGNGKGDGLGDGTGGGIGGAVYRTGGDVSSPILISKVEPEYSEEARRAKYSGTVLLSVVIDEHGIPQDIHVVRPMGLGLDEKAIEAVHQWRFKPGVRYGRAVKVRATVEVSFRLL